LTSPAEETEYAPRSRKVTLELFEIREDTFDLALCHCGVTQ
jgi:hypothetical protein